MLKASAFPFRTFNAISYGKYDLARVILALTTLFTVWVSDPSELFATSVLQGTWSPRCSGAGIVSIFCVMGSFELGRWVLTIVLLWVISGFVPRLSIVPQWWVTASIFWSALTVDGGDQVAMIVLLLLILVYANDRRTWIWHGFTSQELHGRRSAVVAVAANLFVLQMSVLYFQAAFAKLHSAEWREGSAIYYWSRHSVFGFFGANSSLADFLLTNVAFVPLATWSVIVGEAFLGFAVAFGARKVRMVALVVGISFHSGIALFIGLSSFGCYMIAFLFAAMLRPDESVLNWSSNRKENLDRLSTQPSIASV